MLNLLHNANKNAFNVILQGDPPLSPAMQRSHPPPPATNGYGVHHTKGGFLSPPPLNGPLASPLNGSLNGDIMGSQRHRKLPEILQPFKNAVVVMAPIFGFFGKVDTKVWYSLILLMLLLCHMCIGAVVFRKLETGEVARNKTAIKALNAMVIKYFTMEIGHPRPDNQTMDYLLPEDMDRLLALYKTRCFKTDNSETDSRMWNFWTSLDFASTIVTTIGYGGMAPRTDLGKIFVLLYMLPGMLLMMSYLNIFSTCILILLRKIIKMIRKLASLDRLPDLLEQGIVLLITLFFLALYLVLMATLMHLNNPDNDSFLQSLYFYVITMTTVGFGDITLIDHSYLALIRILFVFCIGLVMVSLVFNAIRELAAAYQRRLVEVSQRIAMKTLAVAKQHRLNHHMGAIENGGGGGGQEKLIRFND